MVGLMVHSADIQDRDGAPDLLKSIKNRWPWLLHVFADGGYAGDKLKKRLQKIGKWTLEIIKRSDKAKGLKSCRAAGSSSGPSPGWVDAADWPRTSKNPSLQQKRGSPSPTSACSPDALQDMDIVETFSSPTLTKISPFQLIDEGFAGTSSCGASVHEKSYSLFSYSSLLTPFSKTRTVSAAACTPLFGSTVVPPA
ncbi:hypothetical protein ACVJMZ_000070 [Sinorhizobium medicae]